jgi:uncharacterized membrane protein YkvA (DUF1232 family)
MASAIATLRVWAHKLKRDVIALWIAARDPRTPRRARLLAGAVAAYALSPIDLIPDIIPILGLLDDLLIIPAGIWLALRWVPMELMAEYRTAALRRTPPRSRVAAIIILALWLITAGTAISWWTAR